jgi:hypothetical protein
MFSRGTKTWFRCAKTMPKLRMRIGGDVNTAGTIHASDGPMI